MQFILKSSLYLSFSVGRSSELCQTQSYIPATMCECSGSVVFRFKEIAMAPNIYHIKSRKYCNLFSSGFPSHVSMKIRAGGWTNPQPPSPDIQISYKIKLLKYAWDPPPYTHTLHHPRKHKYPSDSLWKKNPGSMHASLYRVCRIFCRSTIEPAYLTQNPTPLLESIRTIRKHR